MTLPRRFYDESSSAFSARLEYDGLSPTAQAAPHGPQNHADPRGRTARGQARVYTRWENGDATPLFGTVVKIADILGVSLDELAGRKEPNGDAQIHNVELHRLYRKVDQLSDEDQKALVIVLDSLVKRSRVSRVMAET